MKLKSETITSDCIFSISFLRQNNLQSFLSPNFTSRSGNKLYNPFKYDKKKKDEKKQGTWWSAN